jgi:hypothetical protein
MKNLLVKCIETFHIYIFFQNFKLRDSFLKNLRVHFRLKFYSFAWIFLSITCLRIFIGWLINIYD